MMLSKHHSSFLCITPLVTAIWEVTTVVLLQDPFTPADTFVPVFAWDLFKIFMFRRASAVLSGRDQHPRNVLSAVINVINLHYKI